MSDQEQTFQKPLPKTAFNEFKLRLAGPAQEGARRPPSLSVAVIKNNPRIDVYTNVEGDRDNGKISAPMEAITMFALIVKLEDIANGEPDTQVKITNKTGAPGQQRVISTTVIGKDKEGRCFISVIAQDRPKIKFLFLPSDWHSLVHKDGSPFTEAEISCLYARAWARLMSELVPNVMDTHYMESERPAGGGQGNKGGYNRGGGGGYNNNRGGGYNNNRGNNNYNRNNNGGGGYNNNRGGGYNNNRSAPADESEMTDGDNFPM